MRLCRNLDDYVLNIDRDPSASGFEKICAFPEISSSKGNIKLKSLLEGEAMKMPKQAYTTEFKELAVNRIKEGQSDSTVCKELELNDQTVRNWVKAAAAFQFLGVMQQFAPASCTKISIGKMIDQLPIIFIRFNYA